jgi:hypothetical protein
MLHPTRPSFIDTLVVLLPDLDIFVPDPEPIVPAEKMKSVKSEQKPSAPIRRGKDMDGIFEAWKSATDSKQVKLQTRKRKRDDAKAAESLEICDATLIVLIKCKLLRSR